ncbi:hypothetical protein ELG97_37095 [Rhizobium leguminosarum]|uniref:hypothetical protein n=1 Tax=Rhizobium leguminosarum TaxID=384 RepID=UPI001030957E|nr:hypothetical protein [Rhizobium leguminosarum]TBE73848.1 hypothetical protein ELG97_37095 [Rhizobium leguminosarum]
MKHAINRAERRFADRERRKRDFPYVRTENQKMTMAEIEALVARLKEKVRKVRRVALDGSIPLAVLYVAAKLRSAEIERENAETEAFLSGLLDLPAVEIEEVQS